MRRRETAKKGGSTNRKAQQRSKVKVVTPAPKAQQTAEEIDAAAARARAAKDKLLEFDRTSAARTQVIDDQSDWYDASATSLMWLSTKEREEREKAQQRKRLQIEKLMKMPGS